MDLQLEDLDSRTLINRYRTAMYAYAVDMHYYRGEVVRRLCLLGVDVPARCPDVTVMNLYIRKFMSGDIDLPADRIENEDIGSWDEWGDHEDLFTI